MSLHPSISRLLLAFTCCAVVPAAVASAQDTPADRPGWRANVELGALWHADGAVAPDQPAYGLNRTGIAGGVGIGRFAANGAGWRLSLRGFEDHGYGEGVAEPCLYTTGLSRCGLIADSFSLVGLSLDLASGMLQSVLPLPVGIETGPDIFRTLSRPRNDVFTSQSAATLPGWHVTGLLELGHRSPLELTAGANWLSGGILTWTFPVGLRYAF